MRRFIVRLFLAAQVGLCLGHCAFSQENKAAPETQSASRQQDQSDKDLADLKQKLSGLDSNKGAQDPDRIGVLRAIAHAYRERGAYVAAMPFAQRAVDAARAAYGANDPRVAGELDAMGQLDLLAGDPKAAIANFELIRPMVEKQLGAAHPLYGLLMVKTGAAYLADGRLEDAESASQKGKQILVKAFGPAATEVTPAQEVLGELYLRKGEYAKSEKELAVALALRSEVLSYRPDNMTEADVRIGMAPLENLLGALYAAKGNYDKAAPMLNDALKDFEAKEGRTDSDLEGVLVNLAALAAAQGNQSAADAYRKRAESIHKENMGVAHLPNVPLPQPIKAVSGQRNKN